MNGSVNITTDVVGSYSPGKWLSQGLETDDPPPALAPTWVEKQGISAPSDSFRTTTTYDGFERLVTWKETKPGGFDSLAYAFDRTGNVRTSSGAEVYHGITDRLLQQTEGGLPRTFTYDRAGNLTGSTHNGVTWAYGYDALNRLVSVRRAGVLIARYGYDLAGRRIVKRVYSAASGGMV
jgi:YD repeat-containing protein